MDFNILKHFGRFIILIALQVIILNQIYLGGYITPFVYPLFVLLLPFDVKGWGLLISAFAVGLAVDMFSDSLGMHAAASTIMAFMRPLVIRSISSKSDFETGAEPKIENNGVPWIFTYTLILIFIHHTALFAIEVFRADNIFQLLLRSFLSTSLSVVIIMIIHLLISRQARSRR
jgi:hypothetical protein